MGAAVQTKIINLFGGPGSGKSTLMAKIFSELKAYQLVSEMVPEFAKEKVWEKSFYILQDQIFVFANQLHRLKILNGQVNFAVCDSPILLSIIYDPEQDPLLKQLILKEFNKFENINILIKRENSFYEEDGRIHSLEESIGIDNDIKEILDENNIDYLEESPLYFYKILNYIMNGGQTEW